MQGATSGMLNANYTVKLYMYVGMMPASPYLDQGASQVESG